jgi:hypothetical protein
MFNSNSLEIAIGLTFVYLVLSLLCSTINELIENILRNRAKNLRRAIAELVGQTDGESGKKVTKDFVNAIYSHGLVNGLFQSNGINEPKKFPSYIPSKNFALALVAVSKQKEVTEIPPNVIDVLYAFSDKTLGANRTNIVKTDLHSLAEQARQKTNDLEGWYNSAMDRAAGAYKRVSQRIIFPLGLILAIALNADTLQLVRRLSSDPALLNCVVAAAESRAKKPLDPPSALDPATLFRENKQILDDVPVPLGWHDISNENKMAASARNEPNAQIDPDAVPELSSKWGEEVGELLRVHAIGWLLTAVAISLGAPFWFDVLNRIIVVRSTVKPHEKSGEESSKDAQELTADSATPATA